MICFSLDVKEPFSNTAATARYPSRTIGLFARTAIRLGIKPSDICVFSNIGLEASGAVATVNGA
jgi:hypothetical protein